MILDYPAKQAGSEDAHESVVVSHRQAVFELATWVYLFLVAGCLVGISCQMLVRI